MQHIQIAMHFFFQLHGQMTYSEKLKHIFKCHVIIGFTLVTV